MTQAATFGRRGTVAAPRAQTGQPRPALKAAAKVATQPAPRAEAAPKSGERSLLGYFVWLLFRFDGRLDRRTYRYVRIVANLGFVFAIRSLNSALQAAMTDHTNALMLALAMVALLLVMAWTTLAMQVKRRHDRDKAWWWLFVGFIPIAGPIWVLVETCWLEGTPGYNRFDDPARTAAAVF